MQQDKQRRQELGAFLRKRRGELVRSDHHLPPVGRSRLIGLRREEIAYLAGVSVTWYTWLEQGRDIHPSRQVLDSVARTMGLTAAERDYLLSLSGLAPAPTVDLTPIVAPPHLQRLLAAQGDSPAFAVSADWTIAGWNRAYELLYPNVATVPAADRNLLLLIFTDPAVRALLPDWDVTSRHFLAEYRAEAGPMLGHPAHVALVSRLFEQSPEFQAAWNDHQVERFASRERRFHHPAGELIFEHHRLIPSDLPDLHVVVYVPVIESGTAQRMRQLLAPSTTGGSSNGG